MAIQKLTIEQFLELAQSNPVLDVRSPGEYTHAHIPGAFNLPLFTDEERKIVGTVYKQESREKAIKIGLDFFGVKMRKMVEEAEQIIESLHNSKGQPPTSNPQPPTVSNLLPPYSCLIHCWRGGMRSAGVAWLLDLYGFKVYTLVGGYKVYRKWVFAQFEEQYPFNVIGGFTGSGKTLVLQELKKQHHATIDLEGLANHKGSAFGAFGEMPQPKQEMFENLLAGALFSSINAHSQILNSNALWIEDESQRIGNLNIPPALWSQMRSRPVYFLDIPFEERLNYLTEEYGKYEKEKLVNAVIRIQKRLGGLETKNAINHLLENDHKECFRILLTYYDKWYSKGLNNRENLDTILNKIPCTGVETKTNTHKVIACTTVTA